MQLKKPCIRNAPAVVKKFNKSVVSTHTCILNCCILLNHKQMNTWITDWEKNYAVPRHAILSISVLNSLAYEKHTI